MKQSPNWICRLLTTRSFLPFFVTQFLGAFNDNAFKLAMLTLISYHVSQSEHQSEQYQALASALFILPFFLFSATAGQMADKWDQTRIIRWIKGFEVLLMSVGAISVYYGNLIGMFSVLTGLGIHSTFFGPIKYAILPEHLPPKELLGATALIESSTYLAILLGTILGALSVYGIETRAWPVISLLGMTALGGLIASWFIPTTRQMSPNLDVDWHIWRATKEILKECTFDAKVTSHDRGVVMTLYIISWFWWIGSVILMKLPDYTHYVLGASSSIFAFFLTIFSVGLAVGALVIRRCLNQQVTLRYVPGCMALLSIFAADLYWAAPSTTTQVKLLPLSEFVTQFLAVRVAFDLFMLSFCSGLFIVPLYTYLQTMSLAVKRARIIAANNILNALFMVTASIFVMILLKFHVTVQGVFLILAVMNSIIALIFWLKMDSL